MDAKERGDWGEAVALAYLKRKGYVEIASGYRTRFGEIDLIVEDDHFIVFVEVKTRKNSGFAYAREYVGKAKQNKIRATAKLWLVSHQTRLQPRFDVIEIYAPLGVETKSPEIIHIDNAF